MDAEITQAYETGKKYQGKYNSVKSGFMAYDRNFENDFMAVTNGDTYLGVCFEAGLTGAEKPYRIGGWRYGNLPKSGKSHNYADNRPEAGVSMMELDNGDRTQDEISAMFIAAKTSKKVRVIGYLNTVKRGSDGEPLLMWAKENK